MTAEELEAAIDGLVDDATHAAYRAITAVDVPDTEEGAAELLTQLNDAIRPLIRDLMRWRVVNAPKPVT